MLTIVCAICAAFGLLRYNPQLGGLGVGIFGACVGAVSRKATGDNVIRPSILGGIVGGALGGSLAGLIIGFVELNDDWRQYTAYCVGQLFATFIVMTVTFALVGCLIGLLIGLIRRGRP